MTAEDSTIQIPDCWVFDLLYHWDVNVHIHNLLEIISRHGILFLEVEYAAF